MIRYLKEIFKLPGENTESSTTDKKVQVATCALLLEMANADNNFTEEERKKIISVMQRTFDLSREYVDELIELSEERIEQSIDIYGFATTINQNFSKEEKFELLKNLWRLIYTDDTLDMNEDHLMKKIANTLNMEHSDIIAAKLMVKKENQNGNDD
jgi:uncharacterized tellurite resistance protein B-like protein